MRYFIVEALLDKNIESTFWRQHTEADRIKSCAQGINFMGTSQERQLDYLNAVRPESSEIFGNLQFFMTQKTKNLYRKVKVYLN